MLSKSLIQFFVDEGGSVPSLLFDLRAKTMVEVVEIMPTSFRSACSAALSAPTLPPRDLAIPLLRKPKLKDT